MTSSRCCVLFTKPALAGRVKTRLIGRISPAEAADLHRAFVSDLLRRLRDRPFTVQIAWAVEPGDRLPDADFQGFAQVGEDLGARLYNGLRAVGRSHARVAAIGSDHPEIPIERLDEAFDALEQHDLAIGPARDGGYYVIACRSESLQAGIFRDIAWSTPRVLEQTLRRIQELELRVALLAEGDDVDAPEDLERLARFLVSTDHDCPSTENLLRGWGMLT